MPFTPAHKVGVFSAQHPAPRTVVAGTFQPGEPPTLVRAVDGAASADSAPFTGVSFPTATYGFACDRYDTILVGAKFAGSGTVKIAPMVYDPSTDLWMDLNLSGTAQESIALDGSGAVMVPLTVYGWHAVFFRISAVTGSPSNVEVFARPAAGRVNAFFG